MDNKQLTEPLSRADTKLTWKLFRFNITIYYFTPQQYSKHGASLEPFYFAGMYILLLIAFISSLRKDHFKMDPLVI